MVLSRSLTLMLVYTDDAVLNFVRSSSLASLEGLLNETVVSAIW